MPRQSVGWAASEGAQPCHAGAWGGLLSEGGLSVRVCNRAALRHGRAGGEAGRTWEAKPTGWALSAGGCGVPFGGDGSGSSPPPPAPP